MAIPVRPLSTAALSAVLLLSAASAEAAGDHGEPIDVQILSLTDLHGYISPAGGADGTIGGPGGEPLTVGGGAYLATHLDQASQGRSNSIRVANGDNFTGWPWQVTFTRDEPTIEFLNYLGLDVTSVGNHELDISLEFLQDHMVEGGCLGEPGVDTCFPTSTGAPFSGAQFPHLAANLFEESNGKQPLPSSYVHTVHGEDGTSSQIGFIGVTTPQVEEIFSSYQVGQLSAGEMLPAVDRAAQELRAQGVDAVIVLAHEGASHTGSFDACDAPEGPVMDLARMASPAVDAVIGGHWHTAFNCTVTDPAGNPRPVISPGNHGKLFAQIELQIDPQTHDVIRESINAHNVPVTRDVAADPAVEEMMRYWNALGSEIWGRPHGQITEDITAARDDSGESALGNLVADAYHDIGSTLQGQQPVDLALTHPYQIRSPLTYAAGTNRNDTDGTVLFGESWTVQGRASSVVAASIRGATLRTALEQQWQVDTTGSETFVPLSVSSRVRVEMDPTRPRGDRVQSVTIDGRDVRDSGLYRVAMPSRLALGMDGFPALADNTRPVRSDMDYFAFQQWFASQPPLTAPERNRVHLVAEVR